MKKTTKNTFVAFVAAIGREIEIQVTSQWVAEVIFRDRFGVEPSMVRIK